jgi:hypothetical protein
VAPATGVAVAARVITLEAEAAAGTGVVMTRSNASGGRTVHLAPGERRAWSIPDPSVVGGYAISITYSNGRWGAREIMTMLVDASTAGVWEARETGEDDEGGWNRFVTDPVANVRFDRVTHVLTVVSEGGDGCIEIDKVTLERVDLP